MISTPVISSPCTAAERNSTGPGSTPLTTRTGMVIGMWFDNMLTLRSTVRWVPGAIAASPMMKSSRFTRSMDDASPARPGLTRARACGFARGGAFPR